MDLVHFCGYWSVGKCKNGLPKQGEAVPEAGSGTRGGIPRSDRSDRADGGRIRASVVVADEAEYVSSPNRTRGIVWLTGNRHLLAKSLMRSGRVVVLDEGLQDTSQMLLIQDKQVVEALLPHRPDPPLGIGVRVRAWRGVRMTRTPSDRNTRS
jgi:hypothetical protein